VNPHEPDLLCIGSGNLLRKQKDKGQSQEHKDAQTKETQTNRRDCNRIPLAVNDYFAGFALFTQIELVDLGGVEPPTSSMPLKRAPNCATGPHELAGLFLTPLPTGCQTTSVDCGDRMVAIWIARGGIKYFSQKTMISCKNKAPTDPEQCILSRIFSYSEGGVWQQRG
jgi:hypothetical protein